MENKWFARQSPSSSSRQQDHRSPFQRDRARILHSAAFRRLQSKTQVMGTGKSDFYRTRLTHSLEASQIGAGINAQLKNKYPLALELLPEGDALIESLCLAHDLGHPPFGHGGELALHYMMHQHGGFEGNGQTFRIVSHLEPYTENYGMNLSRRTLLGLVKYPAVINELSRVHCQPPESFRQLRAGDWHPAKGLFEDDLATFNWLIAPLSDDDKAQFQKCVSLSGKHSKTRHKSLDCSMMELADDIAYGIHDLEDAIVTGAVSRSDFEEKVIAQLQTVDCERVQAISRELSNKLFSTKHYLQKDAIGELVNYLITAIELVDLNEADATCFSEPILRYNAKLPPSAAKTLNVFKQFVFDYVIRQPELQRMEYKGQQMIMELFEAFASDPLRLLDKETAQEWQKAHDTGLNHYRVIADYIASMTDDSAARVYNSLFIHN